MVSNLSLQASGGSTNHIGDSIQTRDPLDILVADTGGTEDGWSIDGYTSDTNPLLHDLEPDDKLDTTTNVEFAGTSTGEHRPVGCAAGSLALEFGDVADVLELSFGLAQIFTRLATKTTEDVATFFLTTDFDQPTWGLGKDPDDGEEEEKWDNLESNREPPDEGAVTAFVEATGILKPVSDDDTKDVEGEFDGDELTAGLVLGSLGGPDGNDGVQDTGAPTIDETSEDHPGGVHGRSLKSCTQDSPGSTKSDGLDTPVLVTEPTANQAADEGADVVNRNLYSHLAGWATASTEKRDIQCLPEAARRQ